jgi:hypothetical protein
MPKVFVVLVERFILIFEPPRIGVRSGIFTFLPRSLAAQGHAAQGWLN